MDFSDGNTAIWYWLSPLVAFIVSSFTSMGGVSGAFLLLPFQMSFLGFTSPAVSATNQLFNVIAIPSGVYRYFKEGRMVWPLTWIVIAGTLPGVLIGALVRVQYLPDPNRFRLFAALMLLYIGGQMARGLLGRQSTGSTPAEKAFYASIKQGRSGDRYEPEDTLSTRVITFGIAHLEYEFRGYRYRVPNLGVFLLCFIVGIGGGIYGIGGGSIVAPFFVTFFGLPVYTVAGAALMGNFVTSVAGVIIYLAVAPFYPHLAVAPDWRLGLLLGLGGAAGMYIGARSQKRVPAKVIKWILAAAILFVAGRYLITFFFAS